MMAKVTGKQTKQTPNAPARAKGWRQFTVSEVAAALEKSHGLVSFAARLLGCTRGTVYSYLNKYPHLKDIIADAGEALLDKGELALEKAVDKGENWAVQFLLKTKGKQRGYIERVEVDTDWRKELEAAGVKANEAFDQFVGIIADKMTTDA